MPDLPLCLCVLKHRAPLAGGGGASSCQFFFTMDFGLCGTILNLKAFRKDSSHNDRVDCLCRSTRSTSFRTQVRGLITYLAQGLICPKSGTVSALYNIYYLKSTWLRGNKTVLDIKTHLNIHLI